MANLNQYSVLTNESDIVANVELACEGYLHLFYVCEARDYYLECCRLQLTLHQRYSSGSNEEVRWSEVNAAVC